MNAGSMKTITAALLERIERRTQVALATLVGVEGSAPQVLGAAALFGPSGLIAGTLGGGLLEARAEKESRKALKEKRSRIFDIELKGTLDSDEGAICGGAAKVLIDAAPEKSGPAFQRMERALARGQDGVLLTAIRTGRNGRLLLSRRWVLRRDLGHEPRKGMPAAFRRLIHDSLCRSVSLRTTGALSLFAEHREPRPRLIIAGAGHIGQALCLMASRLGFEVTVVDDRPEFASKRRLPDADRIIAGNIGRSLTRLSLGRDAYVVIVTRGHKADAEALRACLKRPAAYLGMIGSRHKIDLIRADFLARRWASARELGRLAAPIGLPIGSQTVEEIAVSIAAQLILTRRTSKERPRRKEPWFGP